MKYYQVVNTFRYETKHTRPLIRVREITTFAEAHTVHSSAEEAEEQVKVGIEIYKKLFNDLGIPYTISKRPSWDKFPGAIYTMAFDTLLPDGKVLQIGTVHNLGQTFAKTYDITFENKEGEHEYVYQTCYGISDRVIAAAIGIHGDEKGLVLPPKISPKQVTIIPILFKKGREEVLSKCNEIKEDLENEGIRVKIDDRDIRPGKKFYEWELKGTPLRLELGPRDLENNKAIIVRRDNLEKVEVNLNDDIVSHVKGILEDIDGLLRENAWDSFKENIKSVDNVEDIPELIENGKMVTFPWCGDDECGKSIEELTNIDLLGIYKEDDETSDVCAHCGKPAKHIALIAKTY
jgi:prolyl-tRNA synthetase